MDPFRSRKSCVRECPNGFLTVSHTRCFPSLCPHARSHGLIYSPCVISQLATRDFSWAPLDPTGHKVPLFCLVNTRTISCLFSLRLTRGLSSWAFLLTSLGSFPLFHGALRPPLGHLHDKTLCGPCVSSLMMPQPPHCALTSGVSRAPLSPRASAGLCSLSVSQMCTWPCKLCLLNPYPDCPGSGCFSTWTPHTLHVVLLANYQRVTPRTIDQT